MTALEWKADVIGDLQRSPLIAISRHWSRYSLLAYGDMRLCIDLHVHRFSDQYGRGMPAPLSITRPLMPSRALPKRSPSTSLRWMLF